MQEYSSVRIGQIGLSNCPETQIIVFETAFDMMRM
jgi:hypothetical protein